MQTIPAASRCIRPARALTTVTGAIDQSELLDFHRLCRITRSLNDGEHHRRAGTICWEQTDQFVSDCSAIGNLDSISFDLEGPNSLALTLSTMAQSNMANTGLHEGSRSRSLLCISISPVLLHASQRVERFRTWSSRNTHRSNCPTTSSFNGLCVLPGIFNLGRVRAVVAALDPLAKLLHTRRSHRLQQP